MSRSSAASVRVGIAGFGRVAASQYLPALRAHGAFQVMAVADVDPAARALSAELMPSATIFAETAEALQRASVDAWLIALPPAHHFAAARAALERGCHVYVEKPLTLEIDDARQLVAVAGRSERVTCVGYVGRFAPAYVRLKRQLQRLPLARGVAVETRLTFDERTLPTWKQDVARGGGAIYDIAVHHADLVRFLFDSEIVEVLARTTSERRSEDTAQVRLRLANGVEVKGFFSSAKPAVDRVVVRGADAVWRASRVPEQAAPLRRLATLRRRLFGQGPAADPAFVGCFAAFACSIQQRQPIRPNLEDGMRGVEFAHAALRSAERGKWTMV